MKELEIMKELETLYNAIIGTFNIIKETTDYDILEFMINRNMETLKSIRKSYMTEVLKAMLDNQDIMSSVHSGIIGGDTIDELSTLEGEEIIEFARKHGIELSKASK